LIPPAEFVPRCPAVEKMSIELRSNSFGKAVPAGSHAVCNFAVLLFVSTIFGRQCALRAEDAPAGATAYQTKCASCHGSKGEGTTANYPAPLVGDRSIGELTEYISRAMPEDNPGTCVGEEARLVAEYIHGAFYSPTAQARNKPARIELSRLTVRQFRNVCADMLVEFRGNGAVDERQGLKAWYHKSRNVRGGDVAIERIDPVVNFNFQDKSPDSEKMEPHEFSIRWEGSVSAPETGEYEFVVRTDHATRLWINDLKQPLVDAYVKSGNDTEYRGSLFLLGGRNYALRLEFSKAKQGVDDKKAKERPPLPAMVSLEWKRPHRLREVIPSRYLSAQRPPEVLIVGTEFPPDDRSLGWEKATTISKEWDLATTEAAIEAAGYIAAHSGELAGTKACDADRVQKLKSFCYRLASTAFRRPLADEQRSLYVDRQFDSASDPEAAVQRAVLLILKSPRFLYRELGAATLAAHDPSDVAARISFGLWDSLPDQELRDAAREGRLSTPEQVRAQAMRMAGDRRARTKVREFLLRWLKVERVPELDKDASQFAEFTPAVAHDLRTSLELFLDELLAGEGADFRQLLLAESLYLNGRLAKFYGANLSEDAEFQKLPLESGERSGVLSHPYLLADFAYQSSSSPIHRGVFIARSVLGRTLRPPPEAVTPVPPQLQPDLTTRERVALQTKAESCQSCHAMINSLGFTLEHFDAVGRFRRDDNQKPVNSSGAYRTRNGETIEFGGVRELANFLANSPETHAAFVEQLFHALIKQPIRAYGPHTKESLRQAFAANNFNIQRLMVEIITATALTSTELNSSQPQ
jgi:mono/diheme cytochrome c family protein